MLLELRHIEKRFNRGTPDETLLFSDFSYGVEKGAFVSVVGSNGSGKTTLLNLICGSVAPDAGEILFAGTDMTACNEYRRAARIGRVFQNPAAGTCAHLTILENLALSGNKGRAYGLSRAVDKRRVETYRALLRECGMGLEDRLDAHAGTLSGGQRQALALVLATMSDIELLVLDEHTAALDPKSSETIMELTQRFVANRALTAVMVTHNLRHALAYGDRLTMLHEGRVIMDLDAQAKQAARVDDLLGTFYEISIEKGN